MRKGNNDIRHSHPQSLRELDSRREKKSLDFSAVELSEMVAGEQGVIRYCRVLSCLETATILRTGDSLS